MESEFDPDKGAANRDKLGIDFVSAQELWRRPSLKQFLPYIGEQRELLTGQIDGKFWSAVYTMRGNAVRIISVRRARKDEVEDYERNNAERRDDHER